MDRITGELGQADRVSLRLDSQDQPHVAYYDSGVGALKYAERDDKGWHVEVVDLGNVGECSSLCLDVINRPYIAYYDAADGQLRIASIEELSAASTRIAPPGHRWSLV